MGTDASRSSHIRTVGTFLFLLAAAAVILTVCIADDSSADIAADWSYDENSKILTYSGDASMPDYTAVSNPITELGAKGALNVVFDTPITKIGSYAFAKSSLSSVAVPKTVSSIGEMAFGECSRLKSVSLKENLTSIGERAFYSCSSLISMSMPDSVTEIGSYAFAFCTSLKTLDLPSYRGGTYPTLVINDYTFSGCCSLEHIVIPQHVREIRQYAFAGCSLAYTLVFEQKDIIIGGVVTGHLTELTTLGLHAFEGCSNVKTILLPDKLQYSRNDPFSGLSSLESFTTTEFSTYLRANEGVLYNKSLSALYKYPSAKDGDSFMIPSSVYSVDETAFNGAKNLTNISIGNNLLYASENGVLFMKIVDADNKSILKTIVRYPEGKTDSSYTIPSTITCVNTNAFYGATNLKNLILSTSTLEFKENSLDIGTFGNEYELHISAPDDYRISKAACGLHTTLNYDSEKKDNTVTIIIIASAVAAVVLIAVIAVILIRRKDL